MIRRRGLRGAALALVAGLIALAGAELVLRLAGERFGLRRSELWELRAAVCDGRSRFAPRAYVGWVFDPGHPGVSDEGFLMPAVPRERTPGVARLACLGGSTTAGNLFEGYEGSYPGALAHSLCARLGREVEVLNFGVSGWTSAETLVNWVLRAQDYRPDVVLLHHAGNDVFPRLAPGFRADYSHFTHPWTENRRSWPVRFLTRWSDVYAAWMLRTQRFRLTEHVSVPFEDLPTGPGVLRAETSAPFRRNLETLAGLIRARGGTPVFLSMSWCARLVLGPLDERIIEGMREHNAIARELAAEHGWVFLDLAAEGPELEPEFRDLVHLSPEGNRRKAEWIADQLVARGLLAR